MRLLRRSLRLAACVAVVAACMLATSPSVGHATRDGAREKPVRTSVDGHPRSGCHEPIEIARERHGVHSVDVDRRFPGVAGFGYTEHDPRRPLDRVVDELAADPIPGSTDGYARSTSCRMPADTATTASAASMATRSHHDDSA